jgi:hypothetical protein
MENKQIPIAKIIESLTRQIADYAQKVAILEATLEETQAPTVPIGDNNGN